MAGFVPGRSVRGASELDLAEHKSWHNYLATVLRMSTLLNRELTDSHELSLADVRLLDLLEHAPARSVQMGDLADALAALPSRPDRSSGWKSGAWCCGKSARTIAAAS